jgi:hypothetical protein
MGTEAQAQIRELLVKMLETVDSSPDSLSQSYAALRDGSYELALQVRTAALPSPEGPRIDWVGSTMRVY